MKILLLAIFLASCFANRCYGQAEYSDYPLFYNQTYKEPNELSRIVVNQVLAMKSGETYVKQWEALYREGEELERKAKQEVQQLNDEYGDNVLSYEDKRVYNEYEAAVSKNKSLKKQYDKVKTLEAVAQTSLNLCRGLPNGNCSGQVQTVKRLRARLRDIQSEGKQMINKINRLRPEYNRIKADYNHKINIGNAKMERHNESYKKEVSSLKAELKRIYTKLNELTKIRLEDNEETKPLMRYYTKRLVGTWKIVEMRNNQEDMLKAARKQRRYTFKEDGTYEIKAISGGKSYTLTGKWYFKGTYLTLKDSTDDTTISYEVCFVDNIFIGREKALTLKLAKVQ